MLLELFKGKASDLNLMRHSYFILYAFFACRKKPGSERERKKEERKSSITKQVFSHFEMDLRNDFYEF
jgi:hypothetical protein